MIFSKEAIVSKVLLLLSPIVKFIDKTFTVPYSHKKVTGMHYLLWRDKIDVGMVFLTNTLGAGSNLINPSEINHAAMYFGFGLRDYVENLIDINKNKKDAESIDLVRRLRSSLKKYNIRNNINYVIEAVGKGVVPTDLVSFLTSKDLAIGVKPNFCSKELSMDASRISVYDLGRPYDYAFSHNNGMKYCFELCADSYEKAVDGKKLKRVVYKLFGFRLYDVFLSDTFQTVDWENVFDSRKDIGNNQGH